MEVKRKSTKKETARQLCKPCRSTGTAGSRRKVWGGERTRRSNTGWGGANNQFMIGGGEDKISIGGAMAWLKDAYADAAWECTVRAGRQVLQ